MNKNIVKESQKLIECCYLTNLLTKINEVIIKEIFKDETKIIISLIWEKLSKEEKLCDNCDRKEK